MWFKVRPHFAPCLIAAATALAARGKDLLHMSRAASRTNEKDGRNASRNACTALYTCADGAVLR